MVEAAPGTWRRASRCAASVRAAGDASGFPRESSGGSRVGEGRTHLLKGLGGTRLGRASVPKGEPRHIHRRRPDVRALRRRSSSPAGPEPAAPPLRSGPRSSSGKRRGATAGSPISSITRMFSVDPRRSRTSTVGTRERDPETCAVRLDRLRESRATAARRTPVWWPSGRCRASASSVCRSREWQDIVVKAALGQSPQCSRDHRRRLPDGDLALTLDTGRLIERAKAPRTGRGMVSPPMRSTAAGDDPSAASGPGYLTFRCAGRSFRNPVESVREAARARRNPPASGLAGGYVGVALIRGEPIGVAERRRATGSGRPRRRFLVVLAGRSTALLVDHVDGVEGRGRPSHRSTIDTLLGKRRTNGPR